MSIKLLQISAAYKPAYVYGGPTMSVSKLCEALANAEIDVEVLTTTANGRDELSVKTKEPTEIDGVKVTYFKRLTKDHTHFSPSLLFALRKKIKKQRTTTNKSDKHLIIHIHAWWNLVSIFSCAVAKWYNIPVVLSPRGMLTDYTANNRNVGFKSIIHTTIGKGLLKYCHILATSEKEKQDVLAFVQAKSISVIPNLVNLHKEQIAKSIEHGVTFKLLFLSRIEEKKGLELLFDALADLPFNWQLIIAGSGEEEYVSDLKLKVENLKLDKNIRWIGQIKNDDKFKLIAKHDLLVLTSHNENFANVIIESLSVGTPVLLSDQVGLSPYVKENAFGWVTTLAIEDIRKNIIIAYQSESIRGKIRETAPKIIANDFDSENLIKKYITFYSQINDY